MRRNSFYVDVPYYLIQSVRLVHALAESDYNVHVPAEHVDKVARLREVFNVDVRVGTQDVPVLPGVVVDHASPRTSIGALSRPLIFPAAVTRRCREIWSALRPVRFSFAGLVTEKRRTLLSRWLEHAFPGLNQPVRASREDENTSLTSVDTGEIVLWSSSRGRHFPGKSWDDEYYVLLGRSQFVLCPSGDYVWSYRFFEAVLCGAIPIVERPCPAYDGFHYRLLQERVHDLQYRQDCADRNFLRCLQLLTVSKEELNGQIAHLLADVR